MRANIFWVLLFLSGSGIGARVEVPSAVWWESTVVYQIYPRSFKDTNGDGIGDLNGITENMQYFKDTGVDAIWMSPIFKSPMYDLGYDISDYRDIAPEYGTMKDFDNLMVRAKALGIRVILDFVPNHTSNESEWFLKSAQRIPHYVDYYIWADGKIDPNDAKQILPPSNWLSVYGKSAWEFNTIRQQFFLHQFAIDQADLNYQSTRVRDEMKNVLRFWLDKGVSGFQVDAVNFMFEEDPDDFGGQYPDEPLSGEPGATPDSYDYLNHIYTKDLDATYDVIYDWRAVLDEYEHMEPKLMITEAYTDLDRSMRFYGDKKRKGSVPFNFFWLEGLTKESSARDMKLIIDKWMTYMPSGQTATWVNGNHDQSRLATKHGDNRVDAMNMLSLLLPGITITYQGEEIGMTDGNLSEAESTDSCNTDGPAKYWKKSHYPERTPFQWTAYKNAGFTSTNKTWLPVADNYKTINLKAQNESKNSHYKFYKDMVTVKHLPTVRFGDLLTKAPSDSILIVIRLLPKHPTVVGIVNLSNNVEVVDLSTALLIPDSLLVLASSVNCSLVKGAHTLKKSITVAGHCAVAMQSEHKI